MPTVPAENGFSEIVFRENTHVLNSPTEAEVVDVILNSPEDVMIIGKAPVITQPLEPRFDYRRTIASIDDRLIVDLTGVDNSADAWKFRIRSEKDYLHLIGLGAVQEEQSNTNAGIQLRSTARPDRGVRDILVEDCYLRGLDGGASFVDDWPRSYGNDTGRITVRVRRNIFLDAIGTDSHAIHLYLEGTRTGTFVEECTFHKAGWVNSRDEISLRPGEDKPEANKREHCVYGQGVNMQINLYNNFFGEPAANAYQLRAGGDSIGNVLWRAPVGGWHASRDGQRLIRNVHIDQVDINEVDPNAGRGHGLFISWSSNNTVIENIVARKHGIQKHRPGIETYSTDTVIRNRVLDWGSGGITGGDPNTSYDNIVDNSEGAADHLPSVTDSMLQKWRSRGRKEWNVDATHIAYRNRVQEIVFLRND